MAAKPVPPNAANWVDTFGSTPDTPYEWLEEVSPPASLGTLNDLNELIHRALSCPYVVSGMIADTGVVLSGVHTITAGLVQVTGSGTAYTSELSVGGEVTIGSETRVVSTITSDTVFNVSTAFSASGGGHFGTSGTWYWAQRLNAGCAYLQARMWVGLDSVGTTGAVTPNDAALYSSSSGITTDDRIDIEVGKPGTVVFPPGGQDVELLSSLTYDGAPADPMDRLYEVYLKSADQFETPDGEDQYTEGFSGSGVHGLSAIWTGIKDMTTL